MPRRRPTYGGAIEQRIRRAPQTQSRGQRAKQELGTLGLIHDTNASEATYLSTITVRDRGVID
jgi:hypothetical protein